MFWRAADSRKCVGLSSSGDTLLATTALLLTLCADPTGSNFVGCVHCGGGITRERAAVCMDERIDEGREPEDRTGAFVQRNENNTEGEARGEGREGRGLRGRESDSLRGGGAKTRHSRGRVHARDRIRTTNNAVL